MRPWQDLPMDPSLPLVWLTLGLGLALRWLDLWCNAVNSASLIKSFGGTVTRWPYPMVSTISCHESIFVSDKNKVTDNWKNTVKDKVHVHPQWSNAIIIEPVYRFQLRNSRLDIPTCTNYTTPQWVIFVIFDNSKSVCASLKLNKHCIIIIFSTWNRDAQP